MKGYAHHGFNDFVLCLGYKGWLIKEFFLNYQSMSSDLQRHAGRARVDRVPGRAARRGLARDAGRHRRGNDDRRAAGGRPQVCRGRRPSCCTYGDGVADIDIAQAGRVPPEPRQDRDGHGRAAAGPLRRARSSTDATGRASSPRSRRRPRAGSTAASSSSTRERIWDYLDRRRRTRARARADAAAGRATASSPPTAHGASGSPWTRCASTTCSTSSGHPGARRGRSGSDAGVVLARPPDARHRRHRPGRRLAGRRGWSRRAPTWSAWCATGCRRASWSARR